MKKRNLTLIALALALSFTACGVPNDGQANSSAGTEQSANSNSEQNTSQQGEALPEVRMLYGKITSIVGNEIELSVAEIPESENNETSEPPAVPEDSFDAPAAMMTTPAMSADEVVDAGSNLEYTGETLNLTLSAGTKILQNGQETTLSALKKGSVLSVLIDDVDSMNVGIVDIME